jgi:beta-1,4-mannosyltransferase
MTGDTVIRVLHTAPPLTAETSYGSLISASSPPGVVDMFFTWRIALSGSYDVLHIHWPEALLRDNRPSKQLLKRILTIALLVRTRTKRIPIVRTAHNLVPHERGGAVEAGLLQAIERATSAFISLNDETGVPARDLNVVIPHVSYIAAYSQHAKFASQPGKVLYFGMIRPYKGVERLISEFRSIPDADIALRLVGKATPELAEAITRSAAEDKRISHDLRFVGDEQLIQEISSSDLVVLPYRQMHNSGALLAALSLERRVLVPANPVNHALGEEVGAGWVHFFEGELNSESILAALSGPNPEQPPNLGSRSRERVGSELARLYSSMLGKLK